MSVIFSQPLESGSIDTLEERDGQTARKLVDLVAIRRTHVHSSRWRFGQRTGAYTADGLAVMGTLWLQH